MKEYFVIRAFDSDVSRVLDVNKGKLIADCDDFREYKIDTSSSLYQDLGKLVHTYREKYADVPFTYFYYCREYSKEEISNATLFQIYPKKVFSQYGREHGTKYDLSDACPICKSGEKQVSPLFLRKGTYLNNCDVATSRSHEIVVSNRFVSFVTEHKLKGLHFGPVFHRKIQSDQMMQLQREGIKLDLSDKATYGSSPFYNDKVDIDGTVFVCPNGDNLGCNLFSEAYVNHCPEIEQYDFFISRQTVGYYAGLSNNRQLLFCSPRMRQLIIENGIKGFGFEVAHVVG